MEFLSLLVFLVLASSGYQFILSLSYNPKEICNLHDWSIDKLGMVCAKCKQRPGDNFEK